jgi:hypothetical protein
MKTYFLGILAYYVGMFQCIPHCTAYCTLASSEHCAEAPRELVTVRVDVAAELWISLYIGSIRKVGPVHPGQLENIKFQLMKMSDENGTTAANGQVTRTLPGRVEGDGAGVKIPFEPASEEEFKVGATHCQMLTLIIVIS